MNYKYLIIPTKDLSCGYIGKTCSFEHRAFEERTPQSQAAYLSLKTDLEINGLVNPLVTYRGRFILIGMRRFEIMQSKLQEFDCLDIQEPVDYWLDADIHGLKSWVIEMYKPASHYMG